MKFKKEFKIDHPETIGETDSHFDLSNYTDWLEKKYIEKCNDSNDKVFNAYGKPFTSGIHLWDWITKNCYIKLK